MFRCERCGSSFDPLRAAAMEHCPRCRIRDEIWTPLTVSPPSGAPEPGPSLDRSSERFAPGRRPVNQRRKRG